MQPLEAFLRKLTKLMNSVNKLPLAGNTCPVHAFANAAPNRDFTLQGEPDVDGGKQNQEDT